MNTTDLQEELTNLSNGQLKKLAAKAVNFTYMFRHNSSARKFLVEMIEISIARGYITNYKEVMEDGWREAGDVS